jgi:electron transfer flavoprotein beta subunit
LSCGIRLTGGTGVFILVFFLWCINMDVLVAVKQTVDYRVKVRVSEGDKQVETAHLKHALNPFDAIAVEAAVQWKEQGLVQRVMVVTISHATPTTVLQTCLAMGACEAYHIETSHTPLGGLQRAKLLARFVQLHPVDLVLMGKQAIDSDDGQTGPMLAGLLGWTQCVGVSDIRLDASTCQAVREIDQGLQTIAVSLPSVITADLRLHTPRFPTLPQIVAAKRKPTHTVSADSLITLPQSTVQRQDVRQRIAQRTCTMLPNAEALVTLLQQRGLL